MSPWLPEKLRIGLCPGRLVIERRRWSVRRCAIEEAADPIARLRELASTGQTSVVLSTHYARFAVLPWSEGLAGLADWKAFAEHTFTRIHGPRAADWEACVAPAGRRKARLACAVDRDLLATLRAIPNVASVQPYAAAAVNAGRASLSRSSWFVVQEPGRLAIFLLDEGAWRSARVRGASHDWLAQLEDLLALEARLCDTDCDVVAVHSEAAPPPMLGRYRVVVPPRLAAAADPAAAMVLQ